MTERSEPAEPTEPTDPKPFYVVWSPQGGPPVVRLPTFGAAQRAAVRLSLKVPDQDFFVLASCWERIGTPATKAEAVEIERDAADDPTTKSEATP
jgi:hypothetical protein